MSDNKNKSISQRRMDSFMRAHSAAKRRATKEQAQLPTQPEVQQLANQLDDQMTKVNELLVSLGGTPIVKAVTAVEVASTINTASTNNNPNTDNPDALSADEEQYQATIIQKMVALIQQRKKR